MIFGLISIGFEVTDMKHAEISLNTKRALAEALKKAVKKKPFQKITVTELIKECDVNRKTFYYHFDNIYALLKWTLEEEAIGVVKQFNLLEDYEEAITFVIDYVEQNDYMINCAFDSIGREELKRFFYSDFREIGLSVIDGAEKEHGKKLDEEYKEFLSFFYVEAITGLIIEWIRNREKRDREKVVQYISGTIKASLAGIFEENSVK